MTVVCFQSSRMQRFFIIFFLLGLFFFIPASFVEAHSSLEQTYPLSGATLDQSPSRIELWFEDPVIVHPGSITVTNAKGEQFQKGQPFLDSDDRRHVIALLQSNMPDGMYTVQFNVLSLDGYEVRDRYRFVIRMQSTVKQDLILEKSAPNDGETVKTSPNQIELWFSQPAEIIALGVFNDKGESVRAKEPDVDPSNPRHVIVKLESKLSSGTYQVSWYAAPKENTASIVLSERQGVYYFAVSKVSSISPAQGMLMGGIQFVNVNFKQVLANWLTFLGLLTLFGGTWFSVTIAKVKGNHARWRKVSLWLYGLSIVGFTILMYDRWGQFSQLSWGELTALKFVWVPLLQIVLISLGHWAARGKWPILFFGLALFLWPYVSGHSSYPRYGEYVSMVLDIVHVLAVSIWMGGLAAFMVMTPKDDLSSWFKEQGRAYSKWALWSILVIATTGIGLTLKFLPSFSLASLLISDWGKSLLLKILLFIGMVGIGYLQRHSLKNIALQGLHAFMRRGRIELLYGVLILFAAAILIESNPIAAELGVYSTSHAKDGTNVSVKIAPFRAGTSDIDIHFQNQPEFKQVRVQFYMPPEYMKENTAFSWGNGNYRVTGSFLHAAGTMYMEVEAEKMDGTKTVFPFRIVIPGEIRQYES